MLAVCHSERTGAATVFGAPVAEIGSGVVSSSWIVAASDSSNCAPGERPVAKSTGVDRDKSC